MDVRDPYIYKLTLLENTDSFEEGQVYIGKSKSGRDSYLGSGNIVKYIVRKYGSGILRKDIIVEGIFNDELLNDLERHYIRLHASNIKGFNRSPGGDGRPEVLTEVHQYNLDGEYIQSFPSQKEAAKVIDGLHKPLSDAANPNNRHKAYKGYLWSYIKEQNLPKHTGYKSVQVHKYSMDGKYIETFKSLKEAGKKFGSKGFSSISNVIRGKSRSAYGYQWRKDRVDNCGFYK